jgi:hypothetical protein
VILKHLFSLGVKDLCFLNILIQKILWNKGK